MEVSSGNVFADLGFADADELNAKVRIAVAIRRAIGERGWSRAAAGEALGIDLRELSKLLRYRLEGFSVERLLRFLDRV
jgi:predicted XRE-type DNA-binding protein